MLIAGLPRTRVCSSGTAVLAAEEVRVPSVMQMTSPKYWSSGSLPVLLAQNSTRSSARARRSMSMSSGR
jgi:hypothetical protein